MARGLRVHSLLLADCTPAVAQGGKTSQKKGLGERDTHFIVTRKGRKRDRERGGERGERIRHIFLGHILEVSAGPHIPYFTTF